MGLYYTPPIGNTVNFSFSGSAYAAPGGSATNFDFEPPTIPGTDPHRAQGRNMRRGLAIRVLPFLVALGSALLWM